MSAMILSQQPPSPPRTRRRLDAAGEARRSSAAYGDHQHYSSSAAKVTRVTSFCITGRHSVDTVFVRLSRSFTERTSLLTSNAFAQPRCPKKYVRFSLESNSERMAERFENKFELWYQRRDLLLNQARNHKMTKQQRVQGYLEGTAMLFDHVVQKLPVDCTLIPSIYAGLDDGYRGLERWTEMGKVRRLRVKAIVKMIVEVQNHHEMPTYARTLTKDCQVWATMTGRLDAHVAL